MTRQLAGSVKCWGIEDIQTGAWRQLAATLNGRIVGRVPELYQVKRLAQRACDEKHRPVRVKVMVEAVTR